MSQVYNLDLETMLSTLSRRQLSGTLRADVPRGRVGKEITHIEISVVSGKVVSCSLQNGHASLSGENALQIIAQVEVIPWIFVVSPKQSLALSVQPFAPTGEVLQTCIPKRFGTLQQTELARLPRPYFQVYAYVDGKKTVEEIAQLLRTTPEHVERILSDLQAWRIVQYR